MTWSASLADEIGSLFDTYSWRADDIEDALEIRGARIHAARLTAQNWRRSHPEARKKAVEYTAQWRAKNPELARYYGRISDKRRRERAKVDPIFGAKYRGWKNKTAKAYRERTKEARRDYFREHMRKRRAEKRAALGLGPPAARHCRKCGSAEHNAVYHERRAA